MARKPLPGNPCAWDYSAAYRVYEKLGVKSQKIPKTKHGRFQIDGWTVIVKRAGPKAHGGVPRMFVDFNGREVPFGRVRQALCKTDLTRARRRAAKNRGAGGKFDWRRK